MNQDKQSQKILSDQELSDLVDKRVGREGTFQERVVRLCESDFQMGQRWLEAVKERDHWQWLASKLMNGGLNGLKSEAII